MILAPIALMLRLGQSFYLIVDRDAGALESLRLSYDITRGHGVTIFLVWLIAMLIYMVGFVACGVGAIFTAPLMFLILAVMYVALTGQATIEQLGPDTFPPEKKPHIDPDFGEPFAR